MITNLNQLNYLFIISILKNDKVHCVAPFNHLHIDSSGWVKACCISRVKYDHIRDTKIEDIWQGKNIQKLRSHFSNQNNRHAKCSACYDVEDAGGISLRIQYHEQFGSIDITKPKPTFFDIRFSNVCNFRCRTCWHGASSKWYKEAKILGNTAGDQAIIGGIEDMQGFLQQMGPLLAEAEEIYFAGGEPLYMDQHYQLLEYLIDNCSAKPRLRYNTNASTIYHKSWDAAAMWHHFDEVEIMASIDAVGILGEYIRKEMDWKETEDILHYLHQDPSIKLTISPTVSILNVAHIPELFNYCYQKGWIDAERFYINLLHRPYHYSIQAIPTDEKAIIANKYLNHFTDNTSLKLRKSYQEIIDYMLAKDLSSHFDSFVSNTILLDNMRGEQYNDAWWSKYTRTQREVLYG